VLAGLVAAAVIEVGGNALICAGPRGHRLALIWLVLATTGLVVNTVRWDFARLLGVYVAVFASISVVFGRFVFRESVPLPAWLWLIVVGAVIELRRVMRATFRSVAPSPSMRRCRQPTTGRR
jgi:small multidrug resistance family-3 protein